MHAIPVSGQDLSSGVVGDGQVQRLQLLLFKYWPQDEYPDLAELALANCGTVQKRARLLQAIGPLSLDNLKLLVCRQLRCLTPPSLTHTCCTQYTSGHDTRWDVSKPRRLDVFASAEPTGV